jgi:hypothetical protein
VKNKIESFLFRCFWVFAGAWIIYSGSVGGGGSKTPIVQIGMNKYWVGGLIIVFGLWIVISVIFKDKSK